MLQPDYDLPDHFDDKTIVDAFKSSFLAEGSLLWPFNQNEEKTLLVAPDSRKTYPMICGLLLRLRTGMFRVAKRSRMRECSAEDTYEHRLFRLMRCFVSSDCDEELTNKWTVDTLSMAGKELARKAVFLSARLQKDLNDQPLTPLNADTMRLDFDPSFLRQVAEYHAGVQRPSGTFFADENIPAGTDSGESEGVVDRSCPDFADMSLAERDGEIASTSGHPVEGGLEDGTEEGEGRGPPEEREGGREYLLRLSQADRERCSECGGRRQIYCGDCGGVRLPTAGALLPPRVWLPFDVLLIVHWAEDLHKCTGVQAAALSEEGSVGYAGWPKTMPRKLAFLAPEPKKQWQRREKKEFNEARNALFRARKESEGRGPFDATGQEDTAVDSSGGDRNGNREDILNTYIQVNIDNTPTPSTGRTVTPSLPGQKMHAPSLDDTTGGVTRENMHDIDSKWGAMVCALDPDRDVLLFPSEGAVCASTFDWGSGKGAGAAEGTSRDCAEGSSEGSSGGRWRLVVLEASWQHGKTMHRQLTAYRHLKGLPPLRSVIINGVTGEYWRFHEEGHAAVSTIEAIRHTAQAAGLAEGPCESLLLLFRLQKLRVFRRVSEGGKAPKAVIVCGEGLGSWNPLTVNNGY